MTMSVVDHYACLGVPRNATQPEIKQAYRRAALQWHPDKNPNNREAAELRFKEVGLAYETLNDAERRSQYELQLPKVPVVEKKWTPPRDSNKLFESFFGVHAAQGDACAAAESLLGEMGSLDFAEAMLKFCQQKMQECNGPEGDDCSTAPGSPPMPGRECSSDLESETSANSPRSPAVGSRTPPAEVFADSKQDASPETPEQKVPEAGAVTGQEDDVADGSGSSPTFRTHLRELENEDEQCVLLVRGINRLGFESAAALEEFFTEKTGELPRVLVTHCKSKATGRRRERTRPAAMGFVIFSNAEAVSKVLAEGEHQDINAVQVRVQRFERNQ